MVVFSANLIVDVLQLPDHLLSFISLSFFLLSRGFGHLFVFFFNSGVDDLFIGDSDVACGFFEVEGADITKRRVQDFLLVF